MTVGKNKANHENDSVPSIMLGPVHKQSQLCNQPPSEVTVGTLTVQWVSVKSWKPTNGHTATEGRSGDLGRLLTHSRDGSANYTAKRVQRRKGEGSVSWASPWALRKTVGGTITGGTT